jgi:MFS family permease
MAVTHSAPETTFERVFSFPNPVNEKAARTVAGGVLVVAILTLVLSLTAGHGWLWVCAVLAAGFLARVLSGPTLSPLGQLATRVIAPRLGTPKFVAGPPKRFAQTIGLVVTGGATLAVALGHPLGAQILLALIIVAAGLESIFAICLGCIVFNRLMRAGLIPEETCEACSNISLRYSHS